MNKRMFLRYSQYNLYTEDCFLYLPERKTLFEKIEHYIPNFPNFHKYRRLKIKSIGIHIETLI